MNQNKLLDNFYLFKRKLEYNEYYIQEFKIHDICDPIDSSYSIITNEDLRIEFYEYVEVNGENNQKSGSAYILYKMGKEGFDFQFVESNETTGSFLIFDGKRYFFKKTNKKNNSEIGNFFPIFIESEKSLKFKNFYKHMESIDENFYEIELSIEKNNTLRSFIPFFLFENKKYFGNLSVHTFIFIKSADETNYGYYIRYINNNSEYFFVMITCINHHEFILFLINCYNLMIEYTDIQKTNLFETIMEIPIFNSSLFSVEYKRNKLIEIDKIQRDNFTLVFDNDFLIKVFSHIFMEERIVFLSKSAFQIYQVILFILKSLAPFEWDFLVVSPLPQQLSFLYESPFPFIFGIEKGAEDFNFESLDVIVIDLDEMCILRENKIRYLPFYDDLKYSLSTFEDKLSVMKRYFLIIENNIKILREKAFSKIYEKNEILKTELITFLEDSKRIFKEYEFFKNEDDFFNIFGGTRFFKRYYHKKNFDQICQYSVKMNENSAKLLFMPFVYIDSVNKKELEFDSIKVWIKMLNHFVKKAILFINERGYLKETAFLFFGKLSEANDLENLTFFLNFLKSLKIEIDSKMVDNLKATTDSKIIKNRFFEFFDLSNYRIIPLKICDCNILYTTNKKLIEFLKKNIKSEINWSSKNCRCGNNYSTSLFIYKLENSEIHNSLIVRLILPENIFLLIDFIILENVTKVELMEKEKDLFWNILFYFLYFDLPISTSKNCPEIYSNYEITENHWKSGERHHYDVFGSPSFLKDDDFDYFL
ncbi:hypothetical protein CWI38_0316p0030 [Hamiltosporidium tvaerminnensis]|uniref:cDENN domain-containing protein n=1 Tax=Hamiltosporidium tvaerminnensis TaxID=1176355 RepID=A0A4Q9LZJ9_9MICR|nr:hypothetical protein CWI38_0316p0030 [Hamiltosporidium tvaerminnensis]